MKPASQSPQTPEPVSPGGTRGFPLLEVLLGLAAAGLVVLLFFSVLHRVGRQAKLREWETQLRGFAAVFADYQSRHGQWPKTAGELGTRLTDLGWSRGSPFGGEYAWNPPRAADQPGLIVLTAFHPLPPLSLSPGELGKFDRQIDDGNSSAGNFRTGFNGWPVYVVRKNR